MRYYENGITILPENIKMLQLLSEDEIGEVMKAVFYYMAGMKPEETLTNDTLRLVFEILVQQIDDVNDKLQKTRLFITKGVRQCKQ